MDPTAVGAIIVAAIGAVGGVLKLAFDALNKKDSVFVATIESIENRHEVFLTNHMSTANSTHEALAEAMQAIALAMRDLVNSMDKLHEDNEETARLLRKSDHAADRKTDTVARELKRADDKVIRKVAAKPLEEEE